MAAQRRSRSWIGALEPFARAPYLSAADAAFRDAKVAAGVPLSQVAKMLGVSLDVLERGTVVDFVDPFPPPPEPRQWSRAEKEANRRKMDSTRVWRAPGAKGGAA